MPPCIKFSFKPKKLIYLLNLLKLAYKVFFYAKQPENPHFSYLKIFIRIKDLKSEMERLFRS